MLIIVYNKKCRGIVFNTENLKGKIQEGGGEMPFGDGTGPLGLGPMTGRMAGRCAGFPFPGFWGRGGRRGMGLGRGFGWHWMRSFFPGRWAVPYAGWLPEEEASFLEQEAKILEWQLKAVKKRLHDLRASAEKEEQ
jgi:hypothetical protein